MHLYKSQAATVLRRVKSMARILELTNYTKGGCGVGMRVLKEAQLLASRGHKVAIFSTNLEKGTDKICSGDENVNGVAIKRFPAKKLGGESYMNWNFTKEALDFKPEVIITHAYRHLHTTQALKIAKKLGCKVFLVTHAPFARESSRTILQNAVVSAYDLFIGKRKLKEFSKIIAITKWEQKYLHKLGVKKENIAYIPNGLSDEFFKPINFRRGPVKKIVYIGRISSIKSLETASMALVLAPEYTFKIRGPADPEYLKKLQELIKKNNLGKREIIEPQSYISQEQIDILDQSDVYVLPSKSEGMPQTLIEAMARGKIVVSSNNPGSAELIVDGKNGFLFPISNSKALAQVLKRIQQLSIKERITIQKQARKTAEQFRWSDIIDNLELVLNSN